MGGMIGLAIGGMLGGGASQICGEQMGGISLASLQRGLTVPFTQVHSHAADAGAATTARSASNDATAFIMVAPPPFPKFMRGF